MQPKVLATIVAAFLYLVKGKDLIPDKIPIVGMADDLAVLGLALKFVEPELNAYRAWRDGSAPVANAERAPIAIKAVKLYENGFMLQPFAMGGEGANGLDPAIRYRSSLQNFVIDMPTSCPWCTRMWAQHGRRSTRFARSSLRTPRSTSPPTRPSASKTWRTKPSST